MLGLKRNIERAGRVARGLSGLICLVAAGLIAWAVDWPSWWLVAVAVLTLLGVFQVFEALASWCVTRALGFRTPM